jgi:hypothetical protein
MLPEWLMSQIVEGLLASGSVGQSLLQRGSKATWTVPQWEGSVHAPEAEPVVLVSVSQFTTIPHGSLLGHG